MVRFNDTQRKHIQHTLASHKQVVAPSSQSAPDVKGRLVRNALDFVVRATEDLWSSTDPGERELKYSTINLYEAIELLFKARLMREHWSLVLVDQEISKRTRQDVERGRFRSIDYKAAKERLANIAGFDIDTRADKAFEELRDLRNRYVHFECSEPIETVLSIQLRAWHYVLGMLEDGFLDPLDATEHSLLKRASAAMHRSEAFLEARLAEVQKEIDQERAAGRFVATCPKCVGTQQRRAMSLSSAA